MNCSSRKSRAALLLLATTAITFPALAQAQDAPEGATDDNVIVVTAQRREERLQDVPISISALGAAKLENAQVQSFDDYAKLLPSVSFQSFGPGQSLSLGQVKQLGCLVISDGSPRFRRQRQQVTISRLRPRPVRHQWLRPLLANAPDALDRILLL